MGTLNALSNYDRLSKLFLDVKSKRTIGDERVAGETVIIASIDGKVKVIDAGSMADDSKYKVASLFMTERHAIAYQARGGFHGDYGIAVPYARLSEVRYKVMRDSKKKATFGIKFVPKAGDVTPTVSFITDIADVFAYDGILMTLSSACALAGLRPIDDNDANELADMGLSPLR